MNTKLETEAKNEFEKDFFKIMNNTGFAKSMENVRNHTDIKLVTTNKRRSYLMWEPNYHTTKLISYRNENDKIENEEASVFKFISTRNW